MKKALVLLMALAVVLVSVNVFAGGAIQNSNLSAEYMRTLNRQAATDSADAAIYNPAGMALLQNGLYVNLGNQFVFKTYSAELAGTTYETTEPSLLFPNAILAYKQDDWAAFFTFTVPGGGGTIKYKDGSPSVMALANGTVIPGLPGGNTLTANALEATSMYLCYTLGGAYKINNMRGFRLYSGQHIV